MSHCHRKPSAWAAASGFWDLKPEPWAVIDGLWRPRLPTARLGRLKALSLSRHNTRRTTTPTFLVPILAFLFQRKTFLRLLPRKTLLPLSRRQTFPLLRPAFLLEYPCSSPGERQHPLSSCWCRPSSSQKTPPPSQNEALFLLRLTDCLVLWTYWTHWVRIEFRLWYDSLEQTSVFFIPSN